MTGTTFDAASSVCFDAAGTVFSDANADQFDMVNGTDDCIEINLNCDDPAACNFGAAEICDYPEENYDCDGDCIINVDCFGVCGGDAVEDECGVCDGDGILDGTCDCDGNVEDCAGNCGGSAVEDECGICGGPGYTICWDGSAVCDASDCPDVPIEQVNVLYDTDVAMAGFQ